MIDYGLFYFACPPGVGAAWFTRVAELCRLGKHDPQEAYTPFDGEPADILWVTLLRNPCTWIVDCYERLAVDKEDEGHVQGGLMTVLDRSSLEAFVGDYLKRVPGSLGRIARQYRADTGIRVEDAPWAFLELMESLGVPKVLRDRVAPTGKPEALTGTVLPPYLAKRVADAEREMMEAYDYYV